MGWNGSDRKGDASVQPKVTAKKPSPIRGLVAGGLVVILAAVAYFAFFSGSEKPQSEKSDKGRSRIKEVMPAAASTNKSEVVKKPVNPLDDYNHETKYRDEKGVLRYKKGGARAYDPATLPKDATLIGHDSKGKRIGYALPFKNRAEHEIARLMTLTPGETLHGTRTYDAKFEAEFKKSLQEPIIVSKDDSPYDAELKRQMNQTKIELCDRIAAGEKLADILTETRAELNRLAQYKYNVRETLREELAKPGLTDQEVNDYVEAANKMLKAQGIDPIKGGPIVRRNIKLRSKGLSKSSAKPETDGGASSAESVQTKGTEE